MNKIYESNRSSVGKLLPTPADFRFASPLKYASQIASAIVVLIGILVLIGWKLDIVALKSLLPSLVSMNPTTALAFILSGVSLWLLQIKQTDSWTHRLGQACGCMVVLVGLIKITSYLFGWDLGVDTLLFQEKLGSLSSPSHNRMAPNTAGNFILLGLALIFLGMKTRQGQRLAQYFSLMAAVVSLLAIIGYVYDVKNLYGVHIFIPMALNTGITFSLLCLGILSARYDSGVMSVITSDLMGGVMMRGLLPAAIILPILLGWLRLLGQKAGFYGTEFGIALYAIFTICISITLIWWNARSLNQTDTERQEAGAALRRAHNDLEVRVQERTADLAKANKELEAEIIERKQAQVEVEKSISVLRTTLESTTDAFLVVDREGNITWFNQKFIEMFRIPASIIKSRDDNQALTFVLSQIINPEAFLKKVRDLYSQPTVESFDTLQFVDGRIIERYSQPQVIGKECVGRVWSFRDVTQRKQAEKMIQHTAFYDLLTDLPNRNLLYDRLLSAIRTDSGEGKPMALLLMDLDHFKEINDTLGHGRGDQLLKAVGVRLKSVLFDPDMVARLGGDEFAILLPKLGDAGDVKLVIQKLQDALQPPFMIESLPIAVEASIGVAVYPDHGENPDGLMQRADIAMYVAKQMGSGYIIYDTKHDLHSPRRLALIGELRQAIEKDQLFLHYQPKIGFKTHRIIGMEALVRWQHPEYGFVPPDQFILPAEQTGLIHPLTRWVLKSALSQCQVWHQEGFNIPVSVNLSARNLHDPQLADYLAELLKNFGGAPEQLELEITESAIMAEPQRALEAITRLKAMGLRFALDDFGIGYSSLAYLKKLPVDTIKIDKSFVIDMAKDEDDALIVLSTINLAHNLGLNVVAEGVETEKIWNRLFAFGCDSAQGYYMSKPLPVADLTRWLKESPWGLK